MQLVHRWHARLAAFLSVSTDGSSTIAEMMLPVFKTEHTWNSVYLLQALCRGRAL